jgi:hypothetical protein
MKLPDTATQRASRVAPVSRRNANTQATNNCHFDWGANAFCWLGVEKSLQAHNLEGCRKFVEIHSFFSAISVSPRHPFLPDASFADLEFPLLYNRTS